MNLTKPMLCAFASLRKNNNTPIYRAQMLGFKYLYNNQEVVINYLDFTKTSQTTLHLLPFTLYLLPFTFHLEPPPSFFGWASFTLNPLPFTLYPHPHSSVGQASPFTFHPLPFTLYPSPFTLHPNYLIMLI